MLQYVGAETRWGSGVCLFISFLDLFQQAVNNSFPFSVHDNRHSFQSSGCYLDSVSISLQITSQTGNGPGRHGEGRGLSSKLEPGQNECLITG